MKKKNLVFIQATLLGIVLIVPILSQSSRDVNPRQGDLKDDDKSIRYVDKNKKGCCKIKYPSGGYDFFVSSEDDCRSNLYFDRFLGDNNSLCFHWKE
ncbi:LIC_11321 family protein [Leptospira sp. GIMC2001]|uniref:LIC_11321 family protein n=1 Tax=Leptospira sp. GIMC2001 TaxID=1513297 RepID=UPI00234A709F|nr:hypothetical protein [Leptospira sp. GIMC2001]WCL49215.1 hypothetical protein O4O04_18265 [Leptospira sp. GIMC2001]